MFKKLFFFNFFGINLCILFFILFNLWLNFFKGVCKFFFEVREEGFLFVLVFLIKEIYGNKIYCYFLRFLIRKCVCIVND